MIEKAITKRIIIFKIIEYISNFKIFYNEVVLF